MDERRLERNAPSGGRSSKQCRGSGPGQ